MHCPHCQAEIEEGQALCPSCDRPLTKYAGNITREVSDLTQARLARLSAKPPVIPVMAGVNVFLALFGPLWTVFKSLGARPTINAEGTNYLGTAFGGVGVFMTAIVLIPLAIAFCVVAWGILTQRTWAWTANLLVLGVFLLLGGALGSFLGLGSLVAARVVIVAVLAFLWFRPDVREWFGA
jgi:hypothetical protein